MSTSVCQTHSKKMFNTGVFLVTLTLSVAQGMPQSFVVNNNPCALGAVELYHSYPGDNTRYIQCSQWGRSHVKSCGPGEVWNNGLKTCVHKDTSSSRQRTLNRIYTTGPSGYPADNSQYDYGYYNDNRDSNNVQNYYQAQGEPQYYIDADNNVGIIYGSAHQTSGGSTGTRANVQNDLPSDYNDRSVQSSDSRMYQAYPSTNDQNSLWSAFSSALQAAAQYAPSQNLLLGQAQSGQTDRHQSGRLYGRSTDASFNQPATHNSLWNRYSSSLQQSTNTNTRRHTAAQNPAGRASSTRNYYASGASVNTMPRRSTESRSTQRAAAQPRNTMVAAQRQAPDARTYTGHASTSITQPVWGFDVPELCRDADIRYIAAQNDYHHFYECVKGSAQIKTCPHGEVWVHPLRRCVDLNNPDNQVASHNPCIGSDLRFHPYPADPTKYVECQSWYRVYVWRCKDGLWTQNKQQCSTSTTHSTVSPRDTRTYIPPPPPTNTVTTYLTQYFTVCDNTTFFFAHRNASKYVQCDQIGRSFVKDCALNTTWDDSLKTCVHSRVASFAINEVPASVTAARNMERVSRQLPAEEASDPRLLSYPCPANYAWVMPRKKCVAVSDYQPACDKGYIWNPRLEECIMYVDSSNVGQFPDAEYARPNCPLNLYWDQDLQMCTGGSGEFQTDYGEYLYQIDLSEADFLNYNQQQEQGPQVTSGNTYDPLDFLPNICNVTSGRFYYPYPVPGYKHRFIQCDQLGVMHTQTCGRHSFWNNEIMTCVQHLSVQPDDARQYPAPPDHGYPDHTNILGDTCSQSNTVYHAYPKNSRLFIMCVNGTPELMSCPAGSYWRDEISTCAWPELPDN